MRKAQTAFVAVAPIALQAHKTRLCNQVLRRNRLVTRRQTTLPRYHVIPVASAKPQQETDWNRLSIVENTLACEDHRYIVVNVGVMSERGSLCDSYRMPGMFVQMRPSAEIKPSFFAISSAPNTAGYFEFIVKESESTKEICAMKEGDKIEMSPVMGKGYPMSNLNLSKYDDDKKPEDILLFAAGTGIAPIRAAIESVLNGLDVRKRESVKLFYAARYPERMPLMDRFGMWEEDGVTVIPVMSQPDKSKQKWGGKTGYIQDVLKDIGVDRPKKTGALVCGMQGMTDDVKKILIDSGVPADRILFNF